MIYIDLSRLERMDNWPPSIINEKYSSGTPRTATEWMRDWTKAQAALRNPPPNRDRSWVIKKYSYLWSDVKEYYRDLSDGKCWYCETKTDPGEIDHYRPKNAVHENKAHPGYWWLAFEWKNWRYCCKSCNSKLAGDDTGEVEGKGTHFPLMDDEGNRIFDESAYKRYEELYSEDPLLLDPTRPLDYTHLTFTRDSLPKPATNDKDAWGYRRATKSIYLYHLDRRVLKERRKDLYLKIRDLVPVITDNQNKWLKEKDLSALDSFHRCSKELGQLIAGNAEDSSAARAYLKEHRSNNLDEAWIDDLLTSAISTTQPRAKHISGS